MVHVFCRGGISFFAQVLRSHGTTPKYHVSFHRHSVRAAEVLRSHGTTPKDRALVCGNRRPENVVIRRDESPHKGRASFRGTMIHD